MGETPVVVATLERFREKKERPAGEAHTNPWRCSFPREALTAATDLADSRFATIRGRANPPDLVFAREWA